VTVSPLDVDRRGVVVAVGRGDQLGIAADDRARGDGLRMQGPGRVGPGHRPRHAGLG
jgi:hypothetical protein